MVGQFNKYHVKRQQYLSRGVVLFGTGEFTYIMQLPQPANRIREKKTILSDTLAGYSLHMFKNAVDFASKIIKVKPGFHIAVRCRRVPAALACTLDKGI